MCPRRKQLTDDDVARIAGELLLTHGPTAVTFAEVSKRCGLAPPTLVQRFGSRQTMLAAAAGSVRARIVAAFLAQPDLASPLAMLRSALSELAAHRFLPGILDAAGSLELRKQISYSLAAAMETGEVVRCDIAPLARSIQVAFYGALVAAAADGVPADAETEAAVSAVLSVYV